MAKRPLIIAVLVILSLAVAISLYLLFGELNKAGVQWTGTQAFQLGGPIAAFFVTLTVLWRMYKQAQKIDNPLESRLKSLVGEWQLESQSDQNKRNARSKTTIEFTGGELCISGGTFFDADGKPIGDWNTEMAFSNGNKLKFFYTLTDALAAQSVWKGAVEVNLQPNSKPLLLQGTWQVLGKEFHRGIITMTKIK